MPLPLRPPVALLVPVLAALAAAGACQREAPASSPVPETGAAAASPATREVQAPLPLPGAKDRVGEVMDRFLAASSYHVVMTTTGAKGDGTMEMDFVAPDRYRLTTPMGTQYVVGDTMYMTMNGRTVAMPLPKGQVGEYRDPARLAEHRATLSVEALGSEAVDGRPATRFRLRNTQPQPSESTMWVGADGYPLQIEVRGEAGGQATRTTIRYSRFNDPSIRVQPPR